MTSDWPEACDSCARTDDELVAVHRIYLIPEPSRVDEVEQWCPSCRSHYPHEAAAPGSGTA